MHTLLLKMSEGMQTERTEYTQLQTRINANLLWGYIHHGSLG